MRTRFAKAALTARSALAANTVLAGALLCMTSLAVAQQPVTIRAGTVLEEGATTPGQRLHDAIIELAAEGAPVRVHRVSCLASCERGCAAAISCSGKVMSPSRVTMRA